MSEIVNVSIKNAPPKVIVEYLNSLRHQAYLVDDVDKHKDDKYDYECPVWHHLYDFVFSDDISGVIYERFPDFNPYIPDTTYADDVCHYITEFEDYVNECGDSFLDFESWLREKASNI